MNKFEKMGSDPKAERIERAVDGAFELFRNASKKNLSERATDYSLASDAGVKRKLRKAADVFMSEKPGRIPDEVDLWDIFKNHPEKLKEEAPEDEGMGKVVETGGSI